MDSSTMSASHKTARTAPFLRGFTNSPWTGANFSLLFLLGRLAAASSGPPVLSTQRAAFWFRVSIATDDIIKRCLLDRNLVAIVIEHEEADERILKGTNPSDLSLLRRDEENLGFWIDESAKTLVLADGTPLTVRRFDDRWISADRGDMLCLLKTRKQRKTWSFATCGRIVVGMLTTARRPRAILEVFSTFRSFEHGQPHSPPRPVSCGPVDGQSRPASSARRPRASGVPSTDPSGFGFQQPDTHSAAAAPGPPSR